MQSQKWFASDSFYLEHVIIIGIVVDGLKINVRFGIDIENKYLTHAFE